MDNFVEMEIHYDRHVLSLLLSDTSARALREAVVNGETVSVESHNWMDKSVKTGTYTVNGKRVNYLFSRPDTGSPF